MEKEIYIRIELAKWIAAKKLGLISPHDEDRLNALIATDTKYRNIYEEMMGEENKTTKSVDEEVAWQEFNKRYGLGKRQSLKIRLVKYAVACSILLAGLLLIFTLKKEEVEESIIRPQLAQGVILETENGTILLDNENVSLVEYESTVEVNSNKRQIIYNNKVNTQATEYHIIKVPKYGEYTVQLSDGTKVILNSESTMKYPVTFTDSIREVWITGEGYFDVAKDAEKFFVVHTPKMDTRVLGTVFNVNAYEINDYESATLISGLIQVENELEKRIIQPGQQAVILEENIAVKEVDINIATAWIRGEFYFYEEPLEKIIESLKYWYEFDVVYHDEKLKTSRFTFEAPKYENIETILDFLTETGSVHYDIKGKIITIY